jgi:hypothetical protein
MTRFHWCVFVLTVIAVAAEVVTPHPHFIAAIYCLAVTVALALEMSARFRKRGG